MINNKRLETEIQRDLSQLILKSTNDVIKGSTITDVVLTKDRKIADVYIMSSYKNVVEEFQRSESYFKKGLSQKLYVKKLPKLIFHKDNSFDQGQKIDKLIKEALS